MFRKVEHMVKFGAPYLHAPATNGQWYFLTMVDSRCRVRSLVSLRFWVRGQPTTTRSTPTTQSVEYEF